MQMKVLSESICASAIYPLLGCRLKGSENWRFIGTEIDDLSYTSAKQNVESNNLSERIQIVKIRAEADEPILTPLSTSSTSQKFAFTMCNPPFYASHEELEADLYARTGVQVQARQLSVKMNMYFAM
ncbi:hypothetical protein MPER_11501 [Moniliophthora perniciosa FA553]|nr:hypothetical protein MPER_11501 [Moniliophthora perniciosa FA553]